MKLSRHLLISTASIVAASSVSQAAITWTGAADLSFWNPANWSGGAPLVGGVTEDDIIVNNATLTSLLADSHNLTLGDGFSMTVTNTRIDFIGAGVPKLVQGLSFWSVANTITLNNSVLRTQSIVTGITVNLGSASQLSLGEIDRAINSQFVVSQVNMALNTTVVFENGSNDPALNTSGVNRGNGWSIINTATGQSFSNDQLTLPLTSFVVAGLDTTPFQASSGGDGVNGGRFSITAIPEPSSVGLLGIAALGFLRRRRA